MSLFVTHSFQDTGMPNIVFVIAHSEEAGAYCMIMDKLALMDTLIWTWVPFSLGALPNSDLIKSCKFSA